jgi:hypothetical protein
VYLAVVLALQFNLTNETHLVHILSLLPSLHELHVIPDLSVGGICFGGAFFDALHPHLNPTYLRVITYEGDLSVEGNFLNVLVLRSQVTSRSPMVGLNLQSVDDQSGTYQTSPAKLLVDQIRPGGSSTRPTGLTFAGKDLYRKDCSLVH